MSHRIANLINESEQQVTELIQKLEQKNGHPSHDVRHIADNHQKARKAIEDLGLDPNDTTAKELFHALQTNFEADADQLDQAYGATQKDFAGRAQIAISLINSSLELPQIWTLKKSIAKGLLQQHQPKHVLKAFGYRSFNSLLKREDIGEIYLAAQSIETAAWRKAQARLVSKLDPSSFELRPVSIVNLSAERWESLNQTQLSVHGDDLGTVAVVPSSLTINLPLLSIILLLVKELEYYGADLSQLYTVNNAIKWWASSRDLLANLNDMPVSFNLLDVANSWLYGHGFAKRELKHAQNDYWQSLIERYSNKEELHELFDASVIQKVRQLNAKMPQPVPVYDFAEDFIDG